MNQLSGREQEVLKLIAEEYSSLQISKKLNLSVRTIDAHRKNIGKKIGSSSQVFFTKYAILNRIIDFKCPNCNK